MKREFLGNAAADFLQAQKKAALAADTGAFSGKRKTVFDSANPADDEAVMDNAEQYQLADVALKAAAAVQEWAETSSADLDDGEGLGDRLFGLLFGIADADFSGEITEDEADAMALAQEAAYDYLVSKGASEADADLLVNEFENDVAERVQELIAGRLPDGEDESAADLDMFAFGDGSEESVLDAVYKKRIAFRNGKKTIVRKRVAGTVRLSAKQKMAVRKMLRKAQSGKAMMKRAKSMRMRRMAGK